jgi:hypothetical protein
MLTGHQVSLDAILCDERHVAERAVALPLNASLRTALDEVVPIRLPLVMALERGA